MIEADAEHHRYPDQGGEGREELAPLDLRQHGRREPAMVAELRQAKLLSQAQRTDARTDRVAVEPLVSVSESTSQILFVP